jgi:type I restriction enzyme S subunit
MIPDEWKKKPLAIVAHIQTGIAKGAKKTTDPIELPYLRVANVQDGYLDLSHIKTIEIDKVQIERYLLQIGDVLLTEGGDFDKLGRGAVWKGEIEKCVHQNHIFVARPKFDVLLPDFLSLLTGSQYGKSYFQKCSKQSTNLASINSTQLKKFPVLLPPLPEQAAITSILSTWNLAIEKAERLIAAKEKGYLWLSTKYLFGDAADTTNTSIKTKWFSVPDHWKIVNIGKIASEVSSFNNSGGSIPVLSCTKYDGLVDSLTYFDKQVFSQDTSTYKVVAKGQFVYATNHIEEGSISYQEVYDKGLVSPMYTVFETGNSVDDSYLYKVLKSVVYLHIFRANTSSSVDRRGSLRWKEFAKLPIPLPPIEEQEKIATILTTARQEIDLLKKQADAYRRQKRGLMQRLLAGDWRVRVG